MENTMYDCNGEEITEATLMAAVSERRAVIVWSHGNWRNVAAVNIAATPEDADDEASRDTRGECWSMADEVWCELATDLRRARMAAHGLLVVR